MSTTQKMIALSVTLILCAAVGFAGTWVAYSVATAPLRELFYEYAWLIRLGLIPILLSFAWVLHRAKDRGGHLWIGLILAAASATAIGCIAYGQSFNGLPIVLSILVVLYFGGGLLAVIGLEERRVR